MSHLRLWIGQLQWMANEIFRELVGDTTQRHGRETIKLATYRSPISSQQRGGHFVKNVPVLLELKMITETWTD